MNSTSEFELINNLNNTFLAKCTDFSTIHANFFGFQDFAWIVFGTFHE